MDTSSQVATDDAKEGKLIRGKNDRKLNQKGSLDN
jgi:hypothetical protein